MSQIDHPAHYARGAHEPIDVIEDWGLGFCLGNTVKYIARAGHKEQPGVTPAAAALLDLKKAQWYLAREIVQREAAS